MIKRDYYSVLGISRQASENEIKKAYRQLALRHHPDKNSGSKISEERFKEASEAYAILSDSRKRASYDQFGHRAGSASFEGFASRSGFESGFGDIFEDIFSDFFKDNFTQRKKKVKRGDDLEYNLNVSLEEAASGAETKIIVFRKESCSACVGSGARKGSQPIICQSCGGTGNIRAHRGFFAVNQTCTNCNGNGQIIQDLCPNCYGNGMAKVKRVLPFKIPAGVETGQRFNISGEGSYGLNGGSPGDVIVVISIRSHSFFERDGYDTHCEIPISFTLAVLGGETEVISLTNIIKLKIPPGTYSGQIFRLKEKGIAKPNGGGYGDQLVKVKIEIPKRITRHQKDLLEEFTSISGETINSHKKNLFRKIKDIILPKK